MSAAIPISATVTIEDLVTSDPPLYGPSSFTFVVVCWEGYQPIRASIIPAETSFEKELPKKAHRDGTLGSKQASLSRVTLVVHEDVGLKVWADPCRGEWLQPAIEKHLMDQYWLHFVEIRFAMNGRRDEPVDFI